MGIFSPILFFHFFDNTEFGINCRKKKVKIHQEGVGGCKINTSAGSRLVVAAQERQVVKMKERDLIQNYERRRISS